MTILVGALGGEGGGVLAEWLYAAAVRAGLAAQSTSIPGVAQRTGATTYYIEVWPQADPAGRRPVFSLNPVPGGIDLLVSSELLETVRQAGAGYVDPDRTRVLSSTARALTVAEKMQLGDGRVDQAALVAALIPQAREVTLMDFGAIARETGTAISAVLLGAIAATGVLPIARAAYEETIRASGIGVEASLRGFERAFAAVATPGPATLPAQTSVKPGAGADLRALGRQRLVAYQDAAYARLYDERLARLDAAAGVAGEPVVQEAARWLALWMAFDDIVHVAGLKLAASRHLRVRREVGAGAGEILRIFDHFKPGVPEFAALLPDALARRLLAWDRARVQRGREPWALPLRLGTHTVAGTLALRLVASLRGQRRRGSRFAHEQQLIERWLGAVERGAREDPALGLELARCGRLVKGYGQTNERGKANLLHLIDHLAFTGAPAAERAHAVARARDAALADDSGHALDLALASRGAPPRPPREQTIRWFRRRPGP